MNCQLFMGKEFCNIVRIRTPCGPLTDTCNRQALLKHLSEKDLQNWHSRWTRILGMG